jgi:hypothetical protein
MKQLAAWLFQKSTWLEQQLHKYYLLSLVVVEMKSFDRLMNPEHDGVDGIEILPLSA